MAKIIIIGAGNIGSRHLQALRKVRKQLEIFVVDPNQNSLKIAKERYYSIPNGNYEHKIHFINNLDDISHEIDIAIIATNSKFRKMVIEDVFRQNDVKYFILEKILFQNKQDYYSVKELLQKKNSKAWVNCPMVMMPIYDKIKNLFQNTQFKYSMIGSKYGLISNIIHFVDFMVYVLKNDDFTVETKYLDRNLIQSKRKGYLELTGTLQIHFDKGAHGFFTCFPLGGLPLVSEFASHDTHLLFRRTEGKAWLRNSQSDYKWKTIDARILYQSELTTPLVEDIINDGQSILTPFEKSMQIHLKLYEPILEFLNGVSEKKYSYFPFS